MLECPGHPVKMLLLPLAGSQRSQDLEREEPCIYGLCHLSAEAHSLFLTFGSEF